MITTVPQNEFRFSFITVPVSDWVDVQATVTGWGRTTNDQDKFQEDFIANKVGSTVLQQVKVPIKSQQSCQDVPEFKFNGLKFDKRFCAGGEKGINFLITDCYSKWTLYYTW